MKIYMYGRWRGLAAAFFFVVTSVGEASSPLVGKDVQGAVVTRAEVIGAMQQALKTDAKPFNDSDQQQTLIDALLDMKTLPRVAQKQFSFDEVENAYIARQAGEAHMRAIAQLLDWRYRDKYKANSPVVLERARELFAVAKGEQLTPPTYEVAHIVIRTDTRSIEEATSRAVTAYDRLKNGEKFDVVATEMSDDPTVATNKGHLPPLRYDQVDSAFARNVMNDHLVGKLLRPFLARSGIHVVFVKKHNPGKAQTFESVQEAFIGRAVEELVASERNRDWSKIRPNANQREYNLSILSDLIKPSVSPQDQKKLMEEAAKQKADVRNRSVSSEAPKIK
ncbi:MAG: peptidylprolyl isomerase [Casimicrobium sp.]